MSANNHGLIGMINCRKKKPDKYFCTFCKVYSNSQKYRVNAHEKTCKQKNLIQNYPLEHSASDPFKSLLEVAFMAFFHASCMNFSEQKIKSILVMMNIAFGLKEKSPNLKISATNSILNYNNRKRSCIHSITPTVHVGHNKKNQEHQFFMNKPSMYLKYLMDDPNKNPLLSSLPDKSTSELNCLQKDEKWQTHKINDIWARHLVKLNCMNFEANHLLTTQFFKQKKTPSSGISVESESYVSYAEDYLVKKDLSVPLLGFVLSFSFQQAYEQDDLVIILWNDKGFAKQ
ncbi:hypothetical protein F4703DRAFT_1795625 [Phycomyces blakesleeanus]